ncbi:MAG: spore germination protein GerW family protein [Bacteroidia bacterium]|nr:spore germination protein GerW family protein [Bacteroidia bacterium]
MNTNFDDLLSKITEFLKNETKTETVIGEQFKLGEYECIPVMRVGLGFGFGEGEGEDKKTAHGMGGGAGAGFGMEPMGFLATRGSEITFVPTRHARGLTVALEKLPDVLAKYFDSTKKPEKISVN